MERFDLPTDFSQTIKNLERRIGVLERAPKATTPGTAQYLSVVPEELLYNAVTSGSWNARFEARFAGPIMHNCFSLFGNLSADAATTGEYRLRVYTNYAGDEPTVDLTTAAVSVAALYNGYYQFSVDMSTYWTLGTQIFAGLIQLEARRTSGAGALNVYWPNHVYTAPLETFDPAPTPIDDLL